MDIKMEMNVSQIQKLIMTVEMRQSIEILQMTATELGELIEKEVLENPLLDINDTERTMPKAVEESPSKNNDVMDWESYAQDVEKNFSTQSETYFGCDEEDEYSFENFSYLDTTLREYLRLQWHTLKIDLTDSEMKLGKYLIAMIDENGYLQIEDDDYEIQDAAMYEKVRKLVQKLDPPGVGARNLLECLQIQLAGSPYSLPIYLEILEKHLRDLAEDNYEKIAMSTGVTLHEIADFREYIKTLEPKPGRIYLKNKKVEYVVPDSFIEWDGNKPIVRITEYSTPRLNINSFYRKILTSGSADEETKEYVKQKLNRASLLIKNVERRRETLRSVVEAVVIHQKDFLKNGKYDIVPMTMQKIAEILEIHESTVSRAIRGKYLQTDFGTYPLKYFFKRGVGSQGMTTDDLRDKIEALIKAEDKSKPLSDEKIAKILEKENIKLARRTVAKYRDELGISSSTKRKRKG